MTASKIEWTDRSDWNPIRGCTRVSPGCGGPGPHGGCYAEAIAGRFSDPDQAFHGYATRTPAGGRWTGKVDLLEDRLLLPLRWKRPAKVFASSTSDVFHEKLSDTEIDRMFAVMALSPHLTFQVLTKRSARMREYFEGTPQPRWIAHMKEFAAKYPRPDIVDPTSGGVLLRTTDQALPNVWLGVSVEDQERANERVPDLLATTAAVRWLSCEPLLGGFNLRKIDTMRFRGCELVDALAGRGMDFLGEPVRRLPKLDWIVVGGESGPRARDNDFLTNARALRDQCADTGVPFFGKQGYRKAELPADLMIREFPA